MFAVERAIATKLHAPAAFVLLRANWDQYTAPSEPVALVEATKTSFMNRMQVWRCPAGLTYAYPDITPILDILSMVK